MLFKLRDFVLIHEVICIFGEGVEIDTKRGAASRKRRGTKQCWRHRWGQLTTCRLYTQRFRRARARFRFRRCTSSYRTRKSFCGAQRATLSQDVNCGRRRHSTSRGTLICRERVDAVGCLTHLWTGRLSRNRLGRSVTATSTRLYAFHGHLVPHPLQVCSALALLLGSSN